MVDVTKERYEKDLRETLLQFGYTEVDIQFYCEARLVVTNYGNNDGILTTLESNDTFQKLHNRYPIDHYNPELFLALAGMTDDKEIKVGDWVIWALGVVKIKNIKGGVMYFYDGCDTFSGNIRRKATKEEIIQHFTKQEAKPEKPEPIFRKGDEVHHFRYGKGEIKDLSENYAHVLFDKCEYGNAWILCEIGELSFTPYNLVTGGFSQQRPKPEIKQGTPVFVWDSDEPNNIKVRRLITILEGAPYPIVVTGSKGREVVYQNYSLENPLK